MSQETRQKLCDAYHIMAHLQLDDHTYTHLSARSEKGFYIYPFGLLFQEVTPEALLEVSLEGNILKGQEYQYNRTGYIIHGEIYKKRPDIQAIFHVHTPEIVAVSACQEGLLPMSQWALHFYKKLAYHDYDALAIDPQQGCKIAEDLLHHYTLLMRHHGSVTAGRTIEEAMFYTYHLQQACKTQCLALGMQAPLIRLSSAVCEKAVAALLSFEQHLGERDWQAWLRLLQKEGMPQYGQKNAHRALLAES